MSKLDVSICNIKMCCCLFPAQKCYKVILTSDKDVLLQIDKSILINFLLFSVDSLKLSVLGCGVLTSYFADIGKPVKTLQKKKASSQHLKYRFCGSEKLLMGILCCH